MVATRPHGSARKRLAARCRTTSRPATPRRATPATRPPVGWAPHSTTPISRSRTTARSATTAIRFQRTTPALAASIAIRRRRTSRHRRTASTKGSAVTATAPPPATPATKTVEANMRPNFVFDLAWFSLAGLLLTTFSTGLFAQTTAPSEKPSVYRVKYIADASVYVDAGRNAGLQEGM